jgi:hypothetical protein
MDDLIDSYIRIPGIPVPHQSRLVKGFLDKLPFPGFGLREVINLDTHTG